MRARISNRGQGSPITGSGRARAWTAGLSLVALVACTGSSPTEPPPPAPAPAPVLAPTLVEPEPPKLLRKVDPGHQALFRALPQVMDDPRVHLIEERVTLGRMLFYEPRLSKSGELSCNSCHPLDNWGVDNEPTSPGHDGQRGTRNSPSVYNAAMQVAQFWDGRAKTVEEQALGPILNPVEMAMPSEAAVVEVLQEIPGYVDAFAEAFPEDPTITFEKVGVAIGAFERYLVTPSRFDAYIAGDGGALTSRERQGLDEFIAAGCPSCHSGPGFGGTMFQKLGVAAPYPSNDLGRFEQSKRESDRYVFKVPSLRNVAKTGPYLHDGSVEDLSEVVRIMARHQTGREMGNDTVELIVTFLEALTGEPDPERIAKPELP